MQSLTDKAHHQIRKWITRYHLKPGTRLNVKDLARTLEMSQTPVREALSMLEREQMIERRPQRGFVVRGLTLREVEDIYDLRISLEELAARQAAKRLRNAERKRLKVLLDDVGRNLDGGDKSRILELTQDFHLIILDASGNRFLSEVGKTILNRIWIIQNINILTTDHLLLEAHPEHVRIFEAIENGESRKAAMLMKEHIGGAKRFVLSRLNDSDDVLSHLIMGYQQ
ncbi:MAG: GntR family transcriptional regulator [Deltaproteobacteria bacterium]|nr:GntR family transcriptional regulator [Deltaproteobacteria bacterium]MBW1923615.1 GntR family transcriptional regulator [Deltaproteobacteria bacterium]MBW1948706.1 GntR family transcriptional regulator [Deltaproteobacteria bacterium]MBW2006875.1 GntR family transcriptional regulator [Deltaproteobacteria bacterium]MBW2101130.1 GntR family transcriptional regulator [Deltaproteobacteria bacterium]